VERKPFHTPVPGEQIINAVDFSFQVSPFIPQFLPFRSPHFVPVNSQPFFHLAGIYKFRRLIFHYNCPMAFCPLTSGVFISSFGHFFV
jgi:hypothetical protein